MPGFLGIGAHEKTAFFIDGASLYKAARGLGFDMDYKRLLAEARKAGPLLRAYYYTALQEDRTQDYSPLRPLVDWLDYNGYTMVTKPAREFTDAQGKKRFKGAIDVELVVDMMTLAPRLDHVILFTGNGDFRRAIEAVQAMGVRVTVISTVKSNPPMASDELRRQADIFIDLVDIEKEIGRAPGGDRPRHKPVQADTPAEDDYDDYDDEDDYDDDDYDDAS